MNYIFIKGIIKKSTLNSNTHKGLFEFMNGTINAHFNDYGVWYN